MNVVGQTFVSAVDHCLSTHVGDTRRALMAFIMEIMMRRSVMMVTPDGLKEASDLVFTSDLHRDFVQAITFAFYSRWGANEQQKTALLENLADGASGDVSSQEGWIAVPKPVQDRMLPRHEITTLLGANRWLVVLLLIKLYVVLDLKELPKAAR